MATGSLSVTITIPSLGLSGGASGSSNASENLAVTFLNTIEAAIGASGATSGTVYYPPGSTTSVGTWTYSPAT